MACRGRRQWQQSTVGGGDGNDGCNGDDDNNQLKAEMVAVVMATAAATTGGGSNNNAGAVPDAKGGEAEVIGVDGDDEDCGADAGSLSTAVVVNGGGNGMEPMEPIGVSEGCGNNTIAAAFINCLCSQRWMPSPLLMTKDNRWLLAVVVINFEAATMMVFDGRDSGRHRG